MGKDPRWDRIRLGCLLGTMGEVHRSGVRKRSRLNTHQLVVLLKPGEGVRLDVREGQTTQRRGLRAESHVTVHVQPRDGISLVTATASKVERALPWVENF